VWRPSPRWGIGTARESADGFRVVFGSFPRSRFMPCPDCGVSVDRVGAGTHLCEPERLLDFRLFQLREEIATFDAQLAAWLETTRGRFAAWLAERDRRAS
jgi:hypothetical protein